MNPKRAYGDLIHRWQQQLTEQHEKHWFHENYKTFSTFAIFNEVFQMGNILFDKKNYQTFESCQFCMIDGFECFCRTRNHKLREI